MENLKHLKKLVYLLLNKTHKLATWPDIS